MDPATSAVRAEQRHRALVRANKVRHARAELKRGIARGEVNVAAVILAPGPDVEGMPVADLLTSQPWCGPRRSSKLLAPANIPATKTVGALTERQRRALAAQLRAPSVISGSICGPGDAP